VILDQLPPALLGEDRVAPDGKGALDAAAADHVASDHTRISHTPGERSRIDPVPLRARDRAASSL
jgi:hypothetical protein